MTFRTVIGAVVLLGAVAVPAAFPAAPGRLPERLPPPERPAPAPIDHERAAERIAESVGPWTVRCRPGGEMTLRIEDLSANTRFVIEVQAAWKLELMAVRAPRGYERRALEPGECALADGPLPGTARYVRLVRMLEARGTEYASEPRMALQRIEVAPRFAVVDIRSPDHVFNAVAWRAAVGPRGNPMIDTYRRSGGQPRYAPFDVTLARCDARCARGRGSTDGVYYITAHILEQR